jgi:hypothetical protein
MDAMQPDRRGADIDPGKHATGTPSSNPASVVPLRVSQVCLPGAADRVARVCGGDICGRRRVRGAWQKRPPAKGH